MARPVRGLEHANGKAGRVVLPPRNRVRESAPLALSYPFGPWSSPDAFGNGWISRGYFPFGVGIPRERTKDQPPQPGGMLTEVEWRGAVLLSRVLCERNELGVGYLGHIVNFVNGDGAKWECVLRDPDPGAAMGAEADPDPAVVRCQKYLDGWREYNGWGVGSARITPEDLDGPDPTPPADRQRESVLRSSRDGEARLRFFDTDDGFAATRFIDPERIRTPQGATPADGWDMGVKTVDGDAETVEAFWEEDPSDPSAGELIPAGRVVSLKANVDGCVKRGVPDFLTLFDSLDTVRGILANIGETTKALSRFMWITEHAPGVTGAALQPLLDGEATHQEPVLYPPSWDGSGTSFGTRGAKQLTGPTVEHTGHGTKVGGIPPTQSEAFIATVQAKLRAAGMRWGAPEYMSGDASNANFASTQVAGGPFVRAVEARQADVARFEQAVAVRALAFGVRLGMVSRADFERVTVQVNPPAVAIANHLEESQRRCLLIDKKILSPQTAAQEEGYDPRAEAANIEAHAARFPDPATGGMPGGGGDEFGGGAGGGGEPPDDGVGEGDDDFLGDFDALLGEGKGGQGAPPHPGLVFDRARSRWVNPNKGRKTDKDVGVLAGATGRKEIKPGVSRVTSGGRDYAVKDRSAIEGGPETEVAVSRLAASAGVLMPPSRLEGSALVTPWVDGKPLASMTREERRAALAEVPRADVDRQALFDYAVGHGDTHNGNYILTPGNRLVGIDKEMSLSVGGLGGNTHYEYPRFLDDVEPRGAGLEHVFDRGTVREMAAAAAEMAESLSGKEARTVRDRAAVLAKLAESERPTAGELWKLGKRGAPATGGLFRRLFGG